MRDDIQFLIDKGYPYKIIGNDSYIATLSGIQPLCDGEYCAIYRYPGGENCHTLEEVKRFFQVIEGE